MLCYIQQPYYTSFILVKLRAFYVGNVCCNSFLANFNILSWLTMSHTVLNPAVHAQVGHKKHKHLHALYR